jgi:chromosome segregation protein
LKKEGGRASFIPLDKIRSSPISAADRELAGHESSKGFLIDFLEFAPGLRKAFEYVCGNTLLVSSLREAKELVGRIRFVTMDGDLAEGSGLLTGGKASAKINVLKEQAELDENSRRHESAKAEKEGIIRGLSALQLSMHELRRRKAEEELKQRAISLELEDIGRKEREQDEKASNLKAAVRELESEIRETDAQADSSDEGRSILIRRLSDLNLVLLENKQKVDLEKEKNYGILLKEKERRISDMKISRSELENRLSALQSKKSVFEKQHADYRKQLAEIREEEDAAKKAILDSEELIRISQAELGKKIALQRELAGALKGLYDERDSLDRELLKLGNQKGRLEFEREKTQTGVNDRNVKKAVAENKLSDLRAQLAAMGEVALLENADRASLGMRRASIEPKVNELSGRVNMLAIEAFSKRLADFEEQKRNVAQLARERESVLSLISEIEGRKISTFMNAFNFVNGNFERLFSQIFRGRGRMVLENAENPFGGGLTMEVALDNKEIKYLELMSGGEKALIALIFLFALQAYNPSSVYILDEADSALDQENSRKLALLLSELTKTTQFLLISHNQTVYKTAKCLVGVTMTKDGSRIVEVRLSQAAPEAGAATAQGG